MVKLNDDLFNGPGGISGFTISPDTSVPTFTKQDANYKFLGNDMTYHQYKKTAFSYTWVVIILLILFMIAIVFIIIFVFRSPSSYPEGSLYDVPPSKNISKSGFYTSIDADSINPLTQKGFVNKGEADNSNYLVSSDGVRYTCVSNLLTGDFCKQLNLSLFTDLELVGSLAYYTPSSNFIDLIIGEDSDGKAIFVNPEDILHEMEDNSYKSFVIDHAANKIYFYTVINISDILVTSVSNIIEGPFLYFTKNEFTGIFNDQYIMIAWPSNTPQTISDYINGVNNVKLLSENTSLAIPPNIRINIIFNDNQIVTITEGSQSTQILTSPYSYLTLEGDVFISWDMAP